MQMPIRSLRSGNVCASYKIHYNSSSWNFVFDSSESAMADFIIVGGGLAGTVVASRLHQRNSLLSIVLIEAGPDPVNHPHVTNFMDFRHLHFTELDNQYLTIPQKHLDGKPIYNSSVKALGGGTVINYGTWLRAFTSVMVTYD
jgi:choline dehydrogenase-like flavoprotein